MPPKGAVLLRLAEVATEHGQPDLAKKFRNAFDREMLHPERWMWRVDAFPSTDFERFLVCGLLIALRRGGNNSLARSLVRVLSEPLKSFAQTYNNPDEEEALIKTFEGLAIDHGYIRNRKELYEPYERHNNKATAKKRRS